MAHTRPQAHLRAKKTVALALSFVLGTGTAWFVSELFKTAHADGERVGAQLALYRTRMARGAPYAGYSYSNLTGTDFRDFAMTLERRRFELKKGLNTIKLAGVPATLDRTTVSLRSRTDPKGTKVIEQRLVNDLQSTEHLLAKAKGGEVRVRTKGQTMVGTLLAYDSSQVTIRTDDKKFPIRVVQRSAIVDLELAAGASLVTSPTLEWKIRAERAGTHEFELGYRAHKISWVADYTAVFDPKTRKVDLSAYATIHNRTGSDFRNAKVVLINRTMRVANTGYGAVASIDGDAKAVRRFELRRPVNSNSGERVQVDLFAPLSGRPAKTVLVYEPLPSIMNSGYPSIDCYSYNVQPTNSTSYRYLEIEPGDVRGAGAFPPGKARVFRRTSSGVLELVSEETVHLDGASENIRLKVGSAKSIKAKRKQLECRHDERARELREKIDLTIKNEGKTAVDIVLRENMNRWTTWTIESESETGQRSGNAAQEYRLRIKGKGQKSLTYTVKYSW